MSLRLNLLGTFQATVGTQRLTRFRSDKVRALLAYLAVEGNQPHRRDSLAALFWSDVPEATARKNLRTSLYRLKGAIEQKANKALTETLFTSNNRSIQANIAGEQGLFWVDVGAFQAALAACEAHEHDDLTACSPCLARLETAVSLYKGQLLPGFNLDDADLFDEWLLLKREQLHQQMQNALDLLIDIQQARQQFDQVRDYCQRQLELEPWRESAFRQLMLALARSGQRSAALAQFEKCRQVLWDELGVEPGEETTAVYKRIKNSEEKTPLSLAKPPSAPPPHNLPARLAPYFGRDTERSELKTLLTNPDNRLVTLVGAGGVGKTSLAVECGRTLAANFADGVWLVALAGLESKSGAMLANEIATAVFQTLSQTLGQTLTGNKPPTEQLLTYLRSRHLLLILDNFEHVIDGADIVRDILQAAPRVSVLATSRASLEFLAEVVFPLTGLPLPPANPDPNSPAPSLQLFADRARRAVRHFALTEANVAQVAQVCRLVEGSPLGIELAAATLRKRPLADLLTAIQTSIDTLATHRRDLPPRHRSMRAVFDGSWGLLPPEEQQILAQLAVFRGSFSAEAAQAVTGATLFAQQTLREKSLVQKATNGRFRLHELLRQFAAEQLAKTCQVSEDLTSLASLNQRHSHFYLNFVAAREAAIQGATPQMPAAEIEQDLDNIRKGWETAVSAIPTIPEASQAIGNSTKTLSLFLQLRGRYQEAAQLFAAAAQQLHEAGDSHALARVTVQQAHALIRLAQYGEAQEVLKTAVFHAQQAQDHLTEGTAHLLWGVSCWRRGEYDVAKEKIQTALLIAQTFKHPSLQAACLHNLGIIHDIKGEYENAATSLDKALEIWQQLLNIQRKGNTLNSSGLVRYHLKDLEIAKAAFSQALEINDMLSDTQGQILNLNNLSLIATEQQQFKLAQAYLTRSLELARQSGDHHGESLIFRNLGWAAYEQGEYEAAQIYLEQALQISRRISDMQGESGILKIMADIARGLDHLDKAIAYYQLSLTICQNIGDKYQACYGLLGLAKTYSKLDNLNQANQCAEKAYRLAQQINNLDLQEQATHLLDSLAFMR